jgi:ribosomal protein S18 acetylase RimI-like enzyme
MNGFDATLLSRVEDAGLNASAPPQQRWIDGWMVRYSPGKAKRARCVNAMATGRLPLEAKLDLAEALFRAAGLPMVVRITPFTQPADLDDILEHRRMKRFDESRVMVADLGALAGMQLPAQVSVEAIDGDRYAEIVGALRGSPASQRAAHAQRLAQSPVPYRGYRMIDSEQQTLVCGQFAAEEGLVGLYDVHTADAARNRGLASALCTHLLALAKAEGARTAYLQVDAANTAARTVYQRLGFRDAYTYHYRSADPAAG